MLRRAETAEGRPSASIALATAIVVALLAVGLLTAATVGADDSPDDQTDAFVAIGQQDGTIVLDDDQDDPINIPACDGDEPLPENAAEDVIWEEACFEIDAEVDGDEWEADAEDVHVPLITDTDPDSLATEASVQISAPEGLSGTIDRDTGELTVEGPMLITADIDAPLGQGDVCETETELEATTGESGALEGEPLDEGTDESAIVVDNEFEVPGFPSGSLACRGANDAYGLPSAAGDSYFELQFDLVPPDVTEGTPIASLD